MCQWPWSTLWAAGSGLLLAAALRADGVPWLACGALAPLIWVVAGARPVVALLAGWVAGVALHVASYSWLPSAVAAMQGVSWWVGAGAAGGFIGYHALQLGLFALCVAWLTREGRPDRTAALVAIPAAWVVLEWGFPRVVPWHLGATLVDLPWVAQSAAVGGVFLLSAMAAGIGGAVVAVLTARSRRRAPIALATAALLAAATAYGAFVLRRPSIGSASAAVASGEGGHDDVVTVGIAQAALPPRIERSEDEQADAWRSYEGLTQSLVAEAGAKGAPLDLVVWPETALKVFLTPDAPYANDLAKLSRQVGAPLLVGALEHGDRAGAEYNSAFLVADSPSPAGSGLPSYRKIALVPFAEYLPIGPWTAWWGWRTTGRFAAGDRPAALAVPLRNGRSLPVGVSICFEALHPGWFNPAVRQGASLLVNLTDDAWLGDSAAAALHLRLVRLRAVETQRWLIRASNSGISAVIAPSGELHRTLPWGTAGSVSAAVQARQQVTPYVRYGNWVVAVCVALLGWGAVDAVRVQRVRRNAEARACASA